MEDIFDLPSVKRGSALRTGSYKLLNNLTILTHLYINSMNFGKGKAFDQYPALPKFNTSAK